jgi:hypothetical protein
VLFAYSAGQGLSGATFSRASDAYRRNRDGTVTPATCAYVRLGWYDVDGDGGWDVPGTVLEGARTNAWEYSEDMTQHSLNSASVTTDAATAPDGSTGADLLLEAAAAAAHWLGDNSSGSSGSLQAMSIFAKRYTRDWLLVQTQTRGATNLNTWFNISTGGVGTQSTDHEASIEGYADGWFRCSVVWNTSSGVSTPLALFHIATSDGAVSYTGTTSDGIYLWGMQNETDQAFVSTYIATSAATASRAADALTFPINFGVQDLTVYAKTTLPTYVDSTDYGGNNPGIVQISSAVPLFELRFGGAGPNPQAIIRDSGGTRAVGSSFSTSEPFEAVAQFRNLKTTPQVRINTSTGFSAWSSTDSVAFHAFGGGTIYLADDPYAGSANQMTAGLQVVKIAQGLATLAEMRNLKTQYGK